MIAAGCVAVNPSRIIPSIRSVLLRGGRFGQQLFLLEEGQEFCRCVWGLLQRLNKPGRNLRVEQDNLAALKRGDHFWGYSECRVVVNFEDIDRLAQFVERTREMGQAFCTYIADCVLGPAMAAEDCPSRHPVDGRIHPIDTHVDESDHERGGLHP